MSQNNKFRIEFLSKSENESFIRSVVGCFMLNLNPSIAEIADVKTAVSEAVTNSIVHGYGKETGNIILDAEIEGNNLHINICDFGKGIDDLQKALEPFYTTSPEDERSGMGFTIMESFSDELHIESDVGHGTIITFTKKFSPVQAIAM